MRNVVILCLAWLIGMPGNSQISSGGTPPSFHFNLKSTDDIPIHVLPEVNHDELLREDLESEASGCNYRVAKGFQVSLNPDNSGVWDNLEDGSRIWRLKIRAPGALAINVFFGQYLLPEGARLFIYSPDRSQVLGAFTSANNKEFGKLNTQPLTGEELVVEYHEPGGLSGLVRLQIANTGHFYKENILYDNGTGDGASETCNTNVACPEGDEWRDEIRSVAKILFQNNSGNYFLCSGALINTTRNDGRPYFLTANHCLPTYVEAESALYYFNYESPVCFPQKDGDKTQTVSGSSIIATCNKLDFCLVSLSNKPPTAYNVFYSGWDATPDSPEEGAGIHHPLGDIKKISFYNDPPITGDFVYQWDFDDNTHWYIEQWDRGITQGGSSGSPLYNQDNKIVGDLTGGSVEGNCTSSDAYYAKLSESWNRYTETNCQLKTWLDPDNTGVTSHGGINASDAVSIPKTRQDLYSIYPNPVEDMLYLQSPPGQSPASFYLYDMSGRMIRSFDQPGNTNTVRIDVSAFSPGLYLLEIRNNSQSVTKKFTIN
jgi:lysyl endopeptidase